VERLGTDQTLREAVPPELIDIMGKGEGTTKQAGAVARELAKRFEKRFGDNGLWLDKEYNGHSKTNRWVVKTDRPAKGNPPQAA
jgi:hypothetical protein